MAFKISCTLFGLLMSLQAIAISDEILLKNRESIMIQGQRIRCEVKMLDESFELWSTSGYRGACNWYDGSDDAGIRDSLRTMSDATRNLALAQCRTKDFDLCFSEFSGPRDRPGGGCFGYALVKGVKLR